MRSINDILDKIKELKGFKRDTELATLFGVKRNTVTNWRHRGTIPYEAIVAICEREELDLTWLLTGQITAKYIDVDGKRVQVMAGGEPGRYIKDEEFEKIKEKYGAEAPTSKVAEPTATFTVRVDIHKEIAEHNAKVLRGLVARMVRIFEEGDYRKTGAVINLLSVLDPRGEDE